MGNGETILIIYGMWGGPWIHDNLRSFFEKKGYDVVIPWLRYHDVDPGADPDPRLGSLSLLDYADDYQKVIEEMDSPPMILGHSMGGLIAQILAQRGLGKHIILLTPAAPAGIFQITPWAFRSFLPTVLRRSPFTTPSTVSYANARRSLMQLLTEEQVKKNHIRMVPESGRVALEMSFPQFDRRKATNIDESRISVPMTIISAGKDRITPASVVRRIYNKYQRTATYREFPDNAHWIPGEPGWERMAEYIHEQITERS